MTQPTQSALEWFYQSGAAEANLPADGVTYELTKVRDECLRLANIDIFEEVEDRENKAALKASAKTLHESALALANSRGSQEKLVTSVDGYLRQIQATSVAGTVLPSMKSVLTSVVVNLVMLAKLSRDVGIRQQIIRLADNCATAFAQSQPSTTTSPPP
jgi:hypothetical protein